MDVVQSKGQKTAAEHSDEAERASYLRKQNNTLLIHNIDKNSLKMGESDSRS